MLKSDLLPPHNGLNADPVLYGVAAGLAELFPPIDSLRSREIHADQDSKIGRHAGEEAKNQQE